jgi:hypothetical protein
MAGKNMDEVVKSAVALLPPVGQDIEFDEFKAKLYAAEPNNGRDAFALMLKNDLVNKTLKTVGDHQHRVMLSRKS